MPELPEVETTAAGLRRILPGRRIVRMETFTAKLRRPLSVELRRHILGRKIIAVRRRAKFLIVEFDNLRVLLIHLGMTGACRIVPQSQPRAKHEHVVWTLDNRLSWRYHDPRRFGLVEIMTIAKPGADPEILQGLPPEPLSRQFSSKYMSATCAGQRPIKLILMDQSRVSGVGNIYDSESLFLAGIRPTRRANSLTAAEIAKLTASIKQILRRAIRAGGTTISDFRDVHGETGQFRLKLMAYGRENEICRHCRSGKIHRIIMGGRSTFYCPICQK
jgi:formamidopyrimidine-DNA glycosylase